tara:strand:+ start:354 stop:512 length:159 start_codon:yes stop_codon:yes gene_type:complete
MSIHERADRMTADADWKEGMNAFRSKISKEITEIYQAIAKLEQTIKRMKDNA